MSIMELAHQLGTELSKEDAVVKYQAAAAAQEQDIELQKALMEYEAMRNELVTKSSEGEDVADLSEGLTKKQDEIMMMPSMKNFLEAREQVEAIMSEIYGTLNFYITGEEPHHCGGDCHGCSGCH